MIIIRMLYRHVSTSSSIVGVLLLRLGRSTLYLEETFDLRNLLRVTDDIKVCMRMDSGCDESLETPTSEGPLGLVCALYISGSGVQIDLIISNIYLNTRMYIRSLLPTTFLQTHYS